MLETAGSSRAWRSALTVVHGAITSRPVDELRRHGDSKSGNTFTITEHADGTSDPYLHHCR